MLHDQANQLRRLVKDCTAPSAPVGGLRPRLALVTGGKGGVGTTTLAVHLAAATARRGPRTVLVDADPDSGNVAVLCGLDERGTLAEVLSGRRAIHEVLQVGPAGVRVVPGSWGLERLSDFPPTAADRLVDQLASMAAQAEVVVVDAGNRPKGIARRLWQHADAVLLVATPETSAILDTYAAVRAMASGRPSARHLTVVNRAPSGEVAEDVYGRLERACRRFLGCQLDDAGYLPLDPAVAVAPVGRSPLLQSGLEHPAARQLDRIARALSQALGLDEASRPQPSGTPRQRGGQRQRKTA